MGIHRTRDGVLNAGQGADHQPAFLNQAASEDTSHGKANNQLLAGDRRAGNSGITIRPEAL